jgi:hypothetical protein
MLNQANSVRNYWTQKQHERDLEQRRAGANQFGGYPPNGHAPPPAPAAVAGPANGGGSDLMAHLTKLSEMRQAGLLSDDEFASAKAKLLAGA